jgi:hypothetical protein
MRRLLLLACLFAPAGCFTAAPPAEVTASVTPPIHSAKTLPPVLPEQVRDTNARQVAQALLDEMDREAQDNALAATPR